MKSLFINKEFVKISRDSLTRFILAIILFPVLFSCNYLQNDSELAINDPEKVTFIGIYGTDTVEIESIESRWKLNSDLEPDPVVLDNFLYAFKNLETAGATTGKGIDSLVSRRILIKMGNKRRIYRFYSSDDFYLLHHEGSAKIFKVRVKSAPDANLNNIFSDQPSFWANRLILNIKPGELQQVEVIPSDSIGQGFTMKRDSNQFRIYRLEGEEIKSTAVNSEKTLLYSSYFSEVYYDSEIREDSIIDRIGVDFPFYTFIIETQEGTKEELNIYPLYMSSGEPDIFHGAITLSGQSRVFKINYVYLDPLFQDLSYFSVE